MKDERCKVGKRLTLSPENMTCKIKQKGMKALLKGGFFLRYEITAFVKIYCDDAQAFYLEQRNVQKICQPDMREGCQQAADKC